MKKPLVLSPHFAIHVGEGVGYTYIRKNACSAFKRMIVETSRFKARYDPSSGNPMAFMTRFHRLSASELEESRTCILVWRDPLERIISGYLSQFLLRLERRDDSMHGNIERTMGMPCEEISFRVFVEEYLPLGSRKINAHFIGQNLHLAPIRYSHVLTLDRLSTDAKALFGDRLADTYFSKRINSTSGIKSYVDPGAGDWPASKIFEHFQSDRMLPDKNSFQNASISEKIAELYEEDIAIWEGMLADRRRNDDAIAPFDARPYVS